MIYRLLTILALVIPFQLNAQKAEKSEPDQQITYKEVGDSELQLHVFLPEGHKASDKRPAIVFFFGGGWNGGAPTQFYPHSEYFASRGIVAISAEYRTRKSHETSPQECVKDGKSAVRWVRTHAKKLGINPDFISFMDHAAIVDRLS